MASDPQTELNPANISADDSSADAAPAVLSRLHAADILERVSDAFVVLDRDWRIVYANREACRINAKPREEFVGKIHWDEWPAAVGTELERQFRRAMTDGVDVHFEHRYVSPPYDVWLEIDAYPSAQGLSLFYRDISARKQAEEALQRSREDLRLAVDAARIGTFYCDYPLDKIVWNDTCKTHFFLPLDAEVDFTLFYILLHPDDREPTRLAIERALNERVGYDVEYRTLAPDGQTRWVNAVGRFYYDGDGEPIRFDGITLDISARKAAEEERERLLAEQQARAEREALLNRLGQTIRSAPDTEAVQETAVSLLGEALGADRCYFAVYDLGRGVVTIARDRCRVGLTSIQGVYPFPNTAEMFHELYHGAATSVIEDAQTAPLSAQTRANMESLGLRARVSVAILDGDGLMATLTAAMADGPRVWTTEETALIEAVATQLRTAVETVRLQQREHRIAEQLQDALQPALPANIPSLSLGKFAKPALDEAAVGGDFFDVFPLDKELYALVIGDVSGKGLAAAQQLALIRNSLRTTLYLYRAPARAAATLNAIVTAHDLLVGFVTAFVGVYDAASGRVTYCSCGHEPGLIRREATGQVEVLKTTGPPLGVAENAEYADEIVSLLGGDDLLLYTDGLSEAGPSRREMLGTGGLSRLLASLPGGLDVQAQAEWLVAEVRAYANGVFRDDVAVLLARRR